MTDIDESPNAARPRLGDGEIDDALASLGGEWSRQGDAIVTTYECDDFPAAIAFVVTIGFIAQAADHHPDLDIRWKKVHVLLTTHSEGGVTALDVKLARAIEAVGPR